MTIKKEFKFSQKITNKKERMKYFLHIILLVGLNKEAAGRNFLISYMLSQEWKMFPKKLPGQLYIEALSIENIKVQSFQFCLKFQIKLINFD